MDRRQFIVTGSVAIAGLAVPRLHGQVLPGRRLFVGFAPRITRSRAVGPQPAAVSPAESIARTEASFLRTGARFAVRGIRRKDDAPLYVRVDVMHGAEGLEEKIPFHAWSYEGDDRRASSPIAFDVPVDPVASLDVRVFVDGTENLVSFNLAHAAGTIALNPGSYIFALGERAPAWTSLSIKDDTLQQGGAPVDFDYLILSVSSPAP